MKLRLTKPAQRDFDHAVQWFRTERPWLAEDFLDDLASAFKQIHQAPEQFPRVEVSVANSTRQWRRVILRRFSYIVVYFVAGDTVVVCKISHSSRDWTSQLTDREE
jgi:plasmid stabilization system protein ParE